MDIALKAFGVFQDILGKKRKVAIDDTATVQLLIEILCKRHRKLRKALYDPAGQWRGSALIVKNGIDIRALQLWDTKLRDGDVVAFLLPMAGG
jgi:molybdopterin converting factor small subunit